MPFDEPRPTDGSRAYSFVGRHLVATYLDCDAAAILDGVGLLRAMEDAIRAAGATILDTRSHVFDGGGLTAVFLLSESHASIHTYPEYNACFVDLFTCGVTCSAEDFDAVMKQYLVPRESSQVSLLRSRYVVCEQTEDKK